MFFCFLEYRNDRSEYTPEDQLIFLNGRFGESCRSKVVGEGQLIAQNGRSFRG